MEWKQPEGLRKHWVLEELDAELLFAAQPVGAAQGRIGDDVYDLRDGGVLTKKRTIARDGEVIATLEEKVPGSGGEVRMGEAVFRWKPGSVMGTRWILESEAREAVMTFHMKQGLAKVARVEGEEIDGVLLLLCWYVTVL